MAITQTLTPFPDPPRIYQAEEEFDAKADEMAGHLPVLTTEINALIPQINTEAANAAASATAAATAKTAAETAKAAALASQTDAATSATSAATSANASAASQTAAATSATNAASSASSAAASAAAVEVASTAEIIAGDIAKQVTASALKTALHAGVSYAAKFEGVGIGRGGGSINSNTAAGTQALNANTTGSYNTAAGMEALNANTTGSYNTAAGMYALRSNTIGSYNTAAGTQALYSNAIGSHNTAAGMYALRSNTIGSYNTAAGMYAGFAGNYNNAIHLGYEAQATADNECKIGNAALTAIRSSAAFYGAAFTVTSDARLKSDIADINPANALQLAKKIKWHTYTKQTGATTRQEAGVIAQELQLITAELGDFEWLVQSSDNYLTVDYTSLYAILERVNQYRFELLEG